MHDVDPAGLIAVFAAIAVASLIPALFPRLGIPGVVLEIAAGVLIGPHVLGLAAPGPVITVIAGIGLATLLLLAGFEVDPDVLTGRPLRVALRGWLLSGVLAAGAAFGLAAMGLIAAPLLTGLALTTTAIGALLPILRDAGRLGPPYGPIILAVGAIGEAAPLIALSLILAGGAGAVGQGLVLIAFAAGAAAAVAMASRTSHGAFAALVARAMGSSGQFPLRLTMPVMVMLVVLSEGLRIDIVPGAFVAGAITRAAMPHSQHEDLLARFDGLGYGLLIPVFFLASGMHIDLPALMASPQALLMVPVFAVLISPC